MFAQNPAMVSQGCQHGCSVFVKSFERTLMTSASAYRDVKAWVSHIEKWPHRSVLFCFFAFYQLFSCSMFMLEQRSRSIAPVQLYSAFTMNSLYVDHTLLVFFFLLFYSCVVKHFSSVCLLELSKGQSPKYWIESFMYLRSIGGKVQYNRDEDFGHKCLSPPSF